VTDTARSLAPELVRAHPRLTEGEHTSPVVMIAIAGEDMEEGGRQAGIRTDRCRDHARGHLFAEGIGYLPGDGHRVTSAEEQDMGEADGDPDPGVTQCGRVGQGRGLFRDPARDPGHTLRIRDIAEAGRDLPAEEGGVSVILGIAGRGRLLNCILSSWLIELVCSRIRWEYLSQIHLLRK
jgi:hypothetical protein